VIRHSAAGADSTDLNKALHSDQLAFRLLQPCRRRPRRLIGRLALEEQRRPLGACSSDSIYAAAWLLL
jgi:hypothetical protein